MLEQARATLDVASRKTMYARLMRKVLNDAPYVFLTYREQGYAYKKGVEGFRVLPGFLVFYSGGELEAATFAK